MSEPAVRRWQQRHRVRRSELLLRARLEHASPTPASGSGLDRERQGPVPRPADGRRGRERPDERLASANRVRHAARITLPARTACAGNGLPTRWHAGSPIFLPDTPYRPLCMVPITKCPPAPAHIRLKPEPQFSRQARPVTKDTEITFNDIERMQCYSHKGFIHMSGTDMLPEYVMSRRAFRRLLTRYVEVRWLQVAAAQHGARALPAGTVSLAEIAGAQGGGNGKTLPRIRGRPLSELGEGAGACNRNQDPRHGDTDADRHPHAGRGGPLPLLLSRGNLLPDRRSPRAGRPQRAAAIDAPEARVGENAGGRGSPHAQARREEVRGVLGTDTPWNEILQRRVPGKAEEEG